jgi:hypothetical protein
MLKKTLRKFFHFLGYSITKNPLYIENKYLNASPWEYQKPLILPNIKEKDLVVDFGSGNIPIPRANLLADFFPDNNFHRSGNVVEDRPLIVCNLERLPLLNKSIDFAFCSHVFEHLDSPAEASDELGRIAKRGYIETPAYNRDILVGTGYMHKWQVVEFEGVMYFFEYSDRQTEAHINSPVMDIWVQKEHHPWQDFFWERQDLFNAIHLWEEKPKIIEFRRKEKQLAATKPWSMVDLEKIGDAPSDLNLDEIFLLESCLSTPDGKNRMKFIKDRFENESGNIIFPVRGKRVYCELM